MDAISPILVEVPSGRKPRIIHLSGSAGAGKSTLAQQLCEDPTYEDLLIKDVDELSWRFNNADPLLFVQQLKEGIVEWIASQGGGGAGGGGDNHQDILLVGILDITCAGKTHAVDMREITTHLFFLDVPVTRLLHQFYSRLATHDAADVFWADVAEDTHRVPSSADIVALNDVAREMHRSMGYALVTPVKFLRKLHKLLK
jgi:hypothetical protein